MSARLGTGEVWITALIVFGCSIIGVGLIGAVVYAVALYPWIGITVLFTLATLLTFSYWAALRLVRREHARRDLEPMV